MIIYSKNEKGFIHLTLILIAISAFVASTSIGFIGARKVQQGQVAGIRTSTEKSTSKKIIDRGLVALGIKENETTTQLAEATEPRIAPSDTGLPVKNVAYSGKQPDKNAPKCADHDDTAYHGVWDDEKGCYYDHTHGKDPSKTIFKDVVEKWKQEISYPWQTPNENTIKHKGYFYIYDEAKDGCEHQALTSGVTNPTCITHILYQVHSIGTTMEIEGRFHSYRVAARVCDKNDSSKCGIVETGGWSDYGTLHCPYKKTQCKLSVDPQPLANDNGILPEIVGIQQPPYRTSVPIAELDRALKSGFMVQFWNNQLINPIISAYYPDKYNVIFGGSWSFLDAWGGVDPTNLEKQHFICEDGSCKYNHSTVQLFTARFENLPQAPFSGYTDRKGNIAKDCTSEGLDCVPLVVSAGVPSGNAWLARKVRQGDPEVAPIYEYDVCFDKTTGAPSTCYKKNDNTVGWIKPQIVEMTKMKMF